MNEQPAALHQRLRFLAVLLLYVIGTTATALLACKFPPHSLEWWLTLAGAASFAALAKLSPGSVKDQ